MLKIIFLSILLASSFSCANQTSANNETNRLAIDKEANSNELKKDTLRHLTFTTGIRSIFEDSKGNYWFGSHQEGVCLFDGTTFTYFTQKDGLSNSQIRTIQEDQNGNIWFGTGNGISSYDGEKFTIHAPDDFGDIPTNDFHSITKASKEAWQKTANDLWFNGGMNTGVYRYDGRKLSYLPFPIEGKNNPDNPYLVTGFAEGKNNRLWMATYAGVFGYDGQDFTIINDENLGLKEDKRQLHIRSIFEDSKGNLWIGNNGIGALLYDGKTTINFTEQQGLSSSETFNNNSNSEKGVLEHVFAIGEDKYGNIWFGDRDTGAWKYDGVNMKNYTKEDGLTSNFVKPIYRDKQGELWFGMANGSVCKFNGKSFERVY